MKRKKDFIKVATPSVGNEEIRAVADVLKSGYYVSGPKVEEFEKRFAKYIGTRYAVAVNSGTAALHLAFLALGLKAKDEVIVPSLTFFATISAVMHAGATPVFVDIDSEIYCISPKDLKKRITKRTKAVVPVHLYGHPADMDEIRDIAIDNRLYIIEDCAQAHGAEYRGQRVGSLGHMGCWSFFATKNMTTLEGGMVTTNSLFWAKKIKMFRSHGMTDRHTHKYIGYNYRMNEVSGAIGLIQLSKLPELNRLRTRNSLYLKKKLKNIKWLTLPKVKRHVKHAWFWFPVRVDEERLKMSTLDLIAYLKDEGIGVRHRYLEPLYKQPALPRRYHKLHLPNIEAIAGKMIGLPNHPELTNEELRKIVTVIRHIRP